LDLTEILHTSIY